MTKNEYFITAQPKSDRLKQHIAYYYFHGSNDPNYSNRFTFYPNYKHALTLYKDSLVRLGNESVVSPSSQKLIATIYSVNINKSISVSIKGVFHKMGIVFHPLGINHFIRVVPSDVMPANFCFFPHLEAPFLQTAEKAFNESDTDTKVNLLDGCFEQLLRPFKELVLIKAIDEILVSNGTIRVEELAEKLHTNRKNLLRLFKKYMLASVEEYKKLTMFRNALKYYQENKGKANLTDTALYNLYYDQAHFIRQFKAFTDKKPSVLLSKIMPLGNEDVYWYFEE